MLEQVGGAAIVLGLVLSVVGLPWLLFRFFRALFGNIAWSKVLRPLALLVIAGGMIGVPIAINRIKPLDLGPHQQTVDGEIHLTLTGWDSERYNYAQVLAARSQATVLQMANPDVTDTTLELLTNMSNLRELDLNDTQITDDGLAILAQLPNLESLRLSNTAITDEGFREHLLDLPGLRQLDLTGTRVASKTIREWKAAQEGRQALK